MKKRILFLTLILTLTLIFLCGCVSNATQQDYSSSKYVFGQDSQENCIAVGGTAKVAESNNSYYYIDEDSSFLYIVDKKSKSCMPLCNRTDCLHDKGTSVEKCNAYLGNMANQIIYYNDALYYFSTREKSDKDGVIHYFDEINRLSLDGNTKENVFSTDKYTLWSFKVHRGYIYADMTKRNSTNTAEGNNSALYKIPLSNTSDIEELLPYYKYSNINGFLVNDYRFYGNNLILMFSKLNDKNEEEKILVNYSLLTHKWVNLSERLSENVTSYFTVCNGDIYYGVKNSVYKCSLSGEDQECAVRGNSKEFKENTCYNYFNPLTNDGENVLISLANNSENSENVIFYNTKTHKTDIHKIETQNQTDVGGDTESLINRLNNTLYFYDKREKRAYSVYSFE